MNKPITLITGTSKGIGKFLCEYYLKKGHVVIGCARSDSDLVDENYHHFNVDVANEKQVINLFFQLKKKFSRLDNLINNAGIALMNHTLLTPLASVEKIFSTNVYGTFLFAREAAKMMMKSNYGRIVNFATVATPIKLEGEAIYAASKAAVESLTQIMAREVADANITINAIGPTPVKTDLIKNVPQEKMDALLNRQANKRYGEFRDISNVLDFFLSKESDFITGQVIYLGGIS
jgi:3-oxoacyl-[acyl-carrier protein] reductase